jgi:hypothetical protein
MRSSFGWIYVLLGIVFITSSCRKTNDAAQTQVIDFESLTVPSAGYWNGSDGSGSFMAGIMKFENIYTASWQTWAGFSYSQKSDVTTPGYINEYSVFDPANQNNKFAIFYSDFGEDLFVSFPTGEEHIIQSVDLCNNTYTGLSMKNGDAYCKKFGGTTGNDPDWFKVTINGYDKSGAKIGSLDVYLADFRFTDSSKDYLISKWTTFDLSSLGKVNKLTFAFSSSDIGIYGINTPTYVCLDNIRYHSDSVSL